MQRSKCSGASNWLCPLSLRSQSVPQSLPTLRPSPSVSLRLSLSMPQSFGRSVAPSHRPSFPLSLTSLRPSVLPVHPHPWPPYLPPSFTVSGSAALNPRSIAAKARQLIPFDHPSLSSTDISLPLFHPLSYCLSPRIRSPVSFHPFYLPPPSISNPLRSLSFSPHPPFLPLSLPLPSWTYDKT